MKLLLPLALAITLPAAAQNALPSPTIPAAPAQSQGTIIAEPVALMIAGFDRNADARVTRAEFDEGVGLSFSDGDVARRSMSLIDLSRWAIKWLGNQGAVPGQFDFDRDGDDAISSGEYGSEFGRIFARFDNNRDMVLDRSELVTMAAPRTLPRQQRRAPRPQPQ